MGDGAAAALAAAAAAADGSAPLPLSPVAGAAFVVAWAALAPPLGAYADARTAGEAARAPVTSLAACGACGGGVTAALQGPSALQAWLVALAATGLLLEGWRLTLFAIRRADRALDAFARAVVDEDGGDDDF